jgi:hypothetical protein
MTMRVKLSYTVEEDQVLAEAAKIIGLAGDDMQQGVSLFTSVQKVLRGDDTNNHVDVSKSLEMIDEFRVALLNVDTRLSEVVEIIETYDAYCREQRKDLTGEGTKAETK